MAQAYDLIGQSDYLNYLYANNAIQYFFNDYASVQTFVLPTLTEANQAIVYNDANYGMGNYMTLAKWMAAAMADHPDQSPAWPEIQAYFLTVGVTLTDEQMTTACANGSMMRQIGLQVAYSVQFNLELRSHWTTEMTIPAQWNDMSVTTGPNVNLIGVEAISSVASLNPSMPYPPEFGAYVEKQSMSVSEYTFSQDDATLDMSRDLGNYHTFLNQEYMRAFYVAYEGEDFDTLDVRFGFKNWETADLFVNYLDEMIDYFLI